MITYSKSPIGVKAFDEKKRTVHHPIVCFLRALFATYIRGRKLLTHGLSQRKPTLIRKLVEVGKSNANVPGTSTASKTTKKTTTTMYTKKQLQLQGTCVAGL